MEEDLFVTCVFDDSSKKDQLQELAKYHSGSCIDFEDVEEDDDEMLVDYQCPFCSDDYDLVELCHHIEEKHQLNANNGVCPVCSKRVKMHMVDHINRQHIDLHKQRLHKDESYSPFSLGTKKYIQSLINTPLSTNHTSKSVPDSLLSFIYNPSSQNQTKLVLSDSSSEACIKDKSFIKDSTEKFKKSLSPMSDTELLEKAKKRDFVQRLISSAMFDHDIENTSE